MKARLRWRCRRGMRELDAVLETFLERGFDALGDDDKLLFEAILNLPDPELYGYLVGRYEPADQELVRLFALIRAGTHPQA